jgi:hypothetical protein
MGYAYLYPSILIAFLFAARTVEKKYASIRCFLLGVFKST